MFARIGYKAIELTTKSLGTCVRKVSSPTTKNSNFISDTIQLASERIKNLSLYNANGTRNHLFNFTKNGQLKITQRVHGSGDLQFLEHVRTGQYVKPKIYPEGTLPCSKEGIKQSNKLAKDIITENEHLINGYRYCGPTASFDDFGRNISVFKSGNAEIVIIDQTLDKTLVKTIDAFKNRINGKNLTDEQKIDELMKFVDEVFSVSKSGTQTKKYVEYMQNQKQMEVLLGDIINSGAGMCRHRALLTKVLADEVKLKCRMVQGYYGGGGHAWNEIITKSDTYLFDSMQGRICNIGNPSRNLDPEAFQYRTGMPESDKLIRKYLDYDSTVGILYRAVQHKVPIKTSDAILTPTPNGYRIETLTDNVLINGEKITGVKELSLGDFVNLKDVGFQII